MIFGLVRFVGDQKKMIPKPDRVGGAEQTEKDRAANNMGHNAGLRGNAHTT